MTAKITGRSTTSAQAAIDEALAAAVRLVKAGNWDQAIEAFEAVVAVAQDEAAVRFAYGKAIAGRDAMAAAEQFRRCAQLQPDNRKAKIRLAACLAATGQLLEAASVLDEIIVARPDYSPALNQLADVRERQGDLRAAFDLHLKAVAASPAQPAFGMACSAFLERQAESAARAAVELRPASADLMVHLGKLLEVHGHSQEATAVYRRALAAAPDSKAAGRGVDASARHHEASTVVRPRRPAIWPKRSDLFMDFENVVRRYVLTELEPGAGLLRRTTKVATMGSCFAEHVAGRLEMRGFDVFYRKIGEDHNNTYANRYLLDWIAEGPSNPRSTIYETKYGPEERQAFVRNFAACDIFIFSLGTSLAFFDAETAQFIPTKEARWSGASQFRTISLEENVRNLQHIIGRMKSLNPAVNVILTVSPVALAGTYGRKSAVQADCVSKSTLRLTVDAVLAERPQGVHYWPSFECVRWLGNHVSRSYPLPFSEEDGDTRHVSLWMQDMIIKLFVEYFGDTSLVENWEMLGPKARRSSLRRNAVA